MSDLDFDVDKPHRGRRRGCLVVLVILAVLGGAGYLGVSKGIEAIQARFSPAPDYPGPGTGSVTFEVREGESAGDMAPRLVQDGVVKSQEAFVSAATANPESRNIQVGFYDLRKQMSAKGALDVLLDSNNILRTSVTIPEGWTVDQIVARLGEQTDYSAKEYRRAIRRDDIGLPAWTRGNPEGYLFPATYDIPPNASAADILSMMVDRWRQAADDAGLKAAAQRLGYTEKQLMIVASLVEAEASRDQDRPKVARVIYNRLEGDETDGLLQIDSTINYGADRPLGARLTNEDLQLDSPYNTYKRAGLPPTPIEAPGDKAIEAAADPAQGGWFYYVTVNLRTGETKFATTYPEFLRYTRELDEYCATQSDSC